MLYRCMCCMFAIVFLASARSAIVLYWKQNFDVTKMAHANWMSPMSEDSGLQGSIVPVHVPVPECPLLQESVQSGSQYQDFADRHSRQALDTNAADVSSKIPRPSEAEASQISRFAGTGKQWKGAIDTMKWVIGANVAVLVIVAIICGAYFGKVAAQNRSTDVAASPSASSTLPPAPTQSGALLPPDSTQGAWPGTSLSVDLNWTSSLGYLFFQDSNASLIFLTFRLNETNHSISFESSDKFHGLHPANGTSLVARVGRLTAAARASLELIYIADNGTLSNVLRDVSVDFTWRPGNLGQHIFLKRQCEMRPR